MSEHTANLALAEQAKPTGWQAPSNGKARKPAPVKPSLFLRLLARLGL